MLGRLIQTAASYGKGNAALESATEEAHTRNLLYGQSQHVYALAQSPPSSPFTQPNFRPGTFDDRGGLELDEKDLRVLIAQDAYGAEEKPMVLFDTNAVQSVAQTSPSHIRHSSTALPMTRSPLPSDWRPAALTTSGKQNTDGQPRNRGSTISSAPSAWTRQVREVGTKEEAFLECMFGVTSSTKTTSTIKMHVIPGKPQPSSPNLGRGISGMDTGDTPLRRAQVTRSRTSIMNQRGQHPVLPALETEGAAHDAILITRLFHIVLPEAVGAKDSNVVPAVSGDSSLTEGTSPTSIRGSGQPKKPKLVERKVPAFAIGLVLNLPRVPSHRPSSTRPNSRSTTGNNLSSSLGSEVQNSWSFLNAIPESLISGRDSSDDTDRRIDIIVNNWEVILRAVATLEREAAAVINEQLVRTLNQVVGPSQKTPKEKSMQRINQRIISITNPTAISNCVSLQRASKHMLRRISYALRIPRVVTGLGFAAGHWSDEARILYRICGRRQQNFFLFNLLTAFLGDHTQWLQRLAPDWYKKQFRASVRKKLDLHTLAPRTIIIADQRAIARRLIFILASFIPAMNGIDGLQKVGEDLAMFARFSTSSPSSQMARSESLRRTANRRMRDHRLQSATNDRPILSTSASSTDSTTPQFFRDRPRQMVRKDSDGLSIRGLQGLSITDSEQRKTGAGTTSAVSPNPTTPVAYFSMQHDSYFPEGAVAETFASAASADLAKILRRSSSSTGNTSNVSSRWGSLVSGISDLWGTKQPHPPELGSMTPYSPGEAVIRPGHASASRSTRPMQPSYDVSGESEPLSQGFNQSSDNRQSKRRISSPPEMQIPFKPLSTAPRLKVDDKDGVIDVDLDLPGFGGDSWLTSPTKRPQRASASSAIDGADSVRSLRSIPTLSPKAPVAEESCVAGYLRRHHEDFAVHAVRPYPEFEDDVKRSMLREENLVHPEIERSDTNTVESWTDVCTTLVADIRTFTIRRIVLRRKMQNDTRPSSSGTLDSLSVSQSKSIFGQVLPKPDETFVDEEVKDFDTVLADAIEKVLNLAEALQPPPEKLHRHGHTRSASTNTNTSTATTQSGAVDRNMLNISQEYARQDCRQVVIGALEEIVRDVSDDLSKTQKGRDIHGSHSASTKATQGRGKQENLLREGIKRWLLDVEQTKAW